MTAASHARRLRALADPAPGRVLHVLCVLGIPELLLRGASTGADLAVAVGADPSALHRVLRVAAALDVVAEDPPGRWQLLPAGELLCPGVPGGLHAEFSDNDLFAVWTEFAHSVRTGEPCYERMFGAPVFTRLQRAPERREAFQRHMAERASGVYGPLVGLPVWPTDGVLLDVAGGTGLLLAMLLAPRPRLQGVLFELPEVAAMARLDGTPDLRSRTRLVAGDVFTDRVPTGDVAVLASVLHDYPDAEAVRILRECADSTNRVLLVERVLPVGGDPYGGFLNDLLMLAMCGGQERTEGEWRALVECAGLCLRGVHAASGTDLAVIECVPRRPPATSHG
ncbi:methyltransferase [Micromonospora sp. NPDC048843]|uniref:methyltransferase n=1 Tax=Micromonospora sp. NPDC048843 TaxID=3155389 RepID=UPI0033C9E0FC